MKKTFLLLLLFCGALFLNTLASAQKDAAEDLPILQRQAIDSYEGGRYEEAVSLYRRIAEAQPGNAGALKDLLIALWLSENYDEAVGVGSRLVKISKTDVDAEFMLARALLATGQKEEALTAFQRCRELDPKEEHIQLAAARVEGMLRDYDSALSHMERLKKTHPDFQELYPELARVQQMIGDFAAAAENWSKAANYFPDNRTYRFHEAESLYYSGQHEAAMQKLQALASGRPRYWPAIDFLTDAALASGNAHAAEHLLESNLETLRPDDQFRLLKLIRIYQGEARWKDVIAAANRWLELRPQSGTAMMIKADALRHAGHYKEAVTVYEQILQSNSAASDAWVGIAQAHMAAGHPEKALQANDKAMALDPTDPYLVIAKSYFLYKTGDSDVHKQMLENWVSSHPEPALPVLLYHGLTPYPQDPMLASSLHRSTSAFDEDMRALHEARFTPVTAEQVNAWVHAKGSLPEQPVMITFDDARQDSLRYGDAILKKYDLKATLFAPVSEVEGYKPKTASWKELEPFSRSGRWEVQSHGYRAHEYIMTDAKEQRGLFLINKRWLPDAQRLETDDEWAARVRQDHEAGQTKIHHHLGYTPKAFGFPEGDFGQAGIPNAPNSADMNLKWAGQYFDSAYHQDEYGINVRTRDPMRLVRFEPPPAVTGAALVRHMIDQRPATLMIRRLLREATWDHRTQDATRWFSELKKRGASHASLLADEARIRLSLGDWEGARVLAEQACREEDSAENRELLADIDRFKHWAWKGSFTYQEDNQHRINRQFRQDLGFWHLDGLELSLDHLAGSYSEAGVETVNEEGGGVILGKQLSPAQKLSLEANGHFLSAQAKNTYTLIGQLRSGWTESLSTVLQGGRDLYYYGRALNANVISHFVDTRIGWNPPTIPWRASARGRVEDLSDNNSRLTGVLEGGRRIFLPRLWIVTRASLDTTDKVSPNYYSPQILQEYQLGVDYTLPLSRGSNLNVAYLPGYGKEKTSDGVFVNDIDATLNLMIGSSLTFSPSVAFIRQPTYHRNTYSATLNYRF